MVYTFVSLQALYVFTLLIMGLFVVAKSLAGMIDGIRRQTFDNTMLVWHYSVAQGLVALAIVEFFPALLS